MKKIVYILTLVLVWATLFSCNQEIQYPYEGKDRVHFKHFTNEANNVRKYIDSTSFSFGLKGDTVLTDTLRVVVELVGNVSQENRTYSVEIATDSTNAIEGVHYKPFSKEQIFRAKRVRDTLKIVVIRKDLSKDYINQINYRLDLKLKENSDFDLGLTKGRRIKIVLNDYMTEPTWWYANFYGDLGYFHPEKWKILISFNEEFGNQISCPFSRNNQGREYLTGLRNYLDAIPVYETIDGKKYRLKLSEKVLIEE